MTSKIIEPNWYILHTKSRFEKVVVDGLQKKSFEVFLPTAHVRSKRKDRKIMLDTPLFPGYAFVRSHLSPDAHLAIVKTVGVVDFINNRSKPIPVDTHIVTSLQIMVAARKSIQTEARFEKGEKIQVVSGPFAGLTGVFHTYKGQGRVYVNIDLLGQTASVEIEEEDIEPISK